MLFTKAGKLNTRNLYNRICACLFCTCFCIVHCIAQNLVPNPGFEIYTKCPRFRTGLEEMLSPPWENPHNAMNNGFIGSPDLYHTCCVTPALGIPKNEWGFQYPHSGQAYAGIIVWSNTHREYIQAPLLEALVAGDTYYIGFYITLADRHCAAEDIGAFMSSGPVPSGGNNIFDYNPQIEANIGFMTDTSSWVLIEGCYVALGGEDHITIGNFLTNSESDLISGCNRFQTAYYYVDDVFVYNMSTLDLGDDKSLCPGDSIILHAGYGNTNYLWHDLSTADTFLVQVPGSYFVETSNICGSSSDTVKVTLQSNPPQITLPDMLTLCRGDSIILDPQLQGVQFEWSDGSNLPQIKIDTAGEYGLTVTNGCGSDEALVVIEDLGPPPTVSLGSGISICPGELLEVKPFHSNVDTWLWSDGSALDHIFISNTGSIHVKVSNECGTASDTVNVVLDTNPPDLDLGEDILACDGESVILNPNVTGVTYLWNDGSTQSTLMTTDAGEFSLQISNACGSSKDTIEVNFLSPPSFPFLGNDTTTCMGEVVTLQWNGPDDTSIQWDNGSTFSSYFVDQSGQYSIVASNACGISVDTIEILFIAPPEPFTLGKDTILCDGQSVLLSVQSNTGEITWQDGSHLSDFVADQSQTYSVTLSNQCGTESDEILVEVDHNMLTYPNELILPLCPEEEIALDVTQQFKVNYQWTTGSLLPVIEIDTTGFYEVTIFNHCIFEKIQFEIIPGTLCDFIPELYELYIPNVFSPNGDNVNDHFIIPNVPYPESFDVQFQVYDRWGNLVFNSNMLPISWDGTFNGSALNPGVYTYYLRLLNESIDKSKTVSGDITIVR